jgi:hypothetical protein
MIVTTLTALRRGIGRDGRQCASRTCDRGRCGDRRAVGGLLADARLCGRSFDEDAAKRSRSASPGLLAYLGSRDGCGYFHPAALGRAGRSDQCDGEVIADLDEILRNFSSLLRITLIETRDRMAGFRKNWIFRELVPALRKSRRRASEPTTYWFRKPNPICPASGNPPLATIADGRRRHV